MEHEEESIYQLNNDNASQAAAMEEVKDAADTQSVHSKMSLQSGLT